MERGSIRRPVGGAQWVGCAPQSRWGVEGHHYEEASGAGVLPDRFHAEGGPGDRTHLGGGEEPSQTRSWGLPETGRHRPHRAGTKGRTVRVRAPEEPPWSLVKGSISVASHRAC